MNFLSEGDTKQIKVPVSSSSAGEYYSKQKHLKCAFFQKSNDRFLIYCFHGLNLSIQLSIKIHTGSFSTFFNHFEFLGTQWQQLAWQFAYRKGSSDTSVAPEPRLGSVWLGFGSSFWSKSSARLGSLNFSKSSGLKNSANTSFLKNFEKDHWQSTILIKKDLSFPLHNGF